MHYKGIPQLSKPTAPTQFPLLHLAHHRKPNSLLPSHTLQKIVPSCSRMRQDPLVRTIPRENHPVRSRGLSIILATIRQDWELVVWPGIGEWETLIVVELVGVVVAADGGAGLDVAAASGDCGVDIGLGVTGIAAALGALAGNEERRSEGGGGDGKREESLGRGGLMDAEG